MSSTWMPRAAMSVATSTRTCPLVKSARLRSRALCDRLPCNSTAGMPAAHSCLASFLAPCLVRMNSSERSSPDASALTTAALSPDGDGEHVMGHRVDRRHFRIDRVHDRIDEVLANQAVDRLVERRREQQPLSAGRRRIEDALDAGQEAEVGHVIGLVEHGDLRPRRGGSAADR